MANPQKGTRVLLGGFEYGPCRNLFECWSLAGTRVRIQGSGFRVWGECWSLAGTLWGFRQLEASAPLTTRREREKKKKKREREREKREREICGLTGSREMGW
jgi:hypothetical protein